MGAWIIFFLFILGVVTVMRWFVKRLREMTSSSSQAEQKLEREILELTRKKHQTPQDAERVARVIEALAHEKKAAAAPATPKPHAQEHRPSTLAEAAHTRPKTEPAPQQTSSMPEVAPSPSVFEAPLSSLLSGGASTGAMAIQSLEQKLDIAGLLAGTPTPIPVPDIDDRALLVRLRSQKSLLVAPASAPESWLDQQLQVYDYVCVASPTRPRVLRRFEDFIADQMFR
ncbi:MAG: hypothetical protein NTW86_00790 [Candidatus Sumerlaeota bacterium]|nr:hypothetical protein [Candidatus Sumerlaeota bacterium]